MSANDVSLFQLASQRMQWLGARQRVISENIANADTPGYRARDVADFASLVVVAQDEVRIEVDQTAWETSLDGNTVVLEQQSIKAAEIAEDYRLAAELYRKGHDLMTLAASAD